MHHIHPFLIAQLLVLLALANGVPLIAKRLFGSALAFPLDNGVTLADGEPLFGHSKTIRGIALSVAVSTLGAPWTGLPSTAGLLRRPPKAVRRPCKIFAHYQTKMISRETFLKI
jgi:hypothetical protein